MRRDAARAGDAPPAPEPLRVAAVDSHCHLDLMEVDVVRAMTADGPWETWFYRRQNNFRMHTAKRRLADAL